MKTVEEGKTHCQALARALLSMRAAHKAPVTKAQIAAWNECELALAELHKGLTRREWLNVTQTTNQHITKP